jgi:hypothetical protein
VEVAGLIWWAVDLWRTMNYRTALVVEIPDTGVVSPKNRVFDIITRYPATTTVFAAFGFSLINNPVARRVFARSVTLEQACRLRHVKYDVLATALRQCQGEVKE